MIACRDYTPHDARLQDYLCVWRELGFERGVVVQPSVYGFDNSAVLSTLENDTMRFRGVVALSGLEAGEQVASFYARGVRGVRINLCNAGGVSREQVPKVVRLAEANGLHVEVQVGRADSELINWLIRSTSVTVVVEHFGLMSNDMRDLNRLLDSGRLWIKLSAPYRAVSEPFPYPQTLDWVRGNIGLWRHRLLWGSDWPHTDLFRGMPSDVDLVNLLAIWLGTVELCKTVLVDNPSELYWRVE